MIAVPSLRIVLATRPVDFRRGHDALAATAAGDLNLDIYSGVIVIFRSRRGDRLKLLTWDGTGLVMTYKRLEQGRFAWPRIDRVAAANEDDLPPGARSMAAREVEVAAGGGAVSLDEAAEKGRVWFRREWLDRHGIDTTQCVVIGVRGQSMEPTLPDGCTILVDRSRTRRRDGAIFVIDTEDGLIVKRLGKSGRRWQLVSDHPSWKPAPWPREAEVIGEVRWASQTFR